jgi:hypothetical protein
VLVAVAAAAETIVVMTMTAVMVVRLAQGHRGSVCGALSSKRDIRAC